MVRKVGGEPCCCGARGQGEATAISVEWSSGKGRWEVRNPTTLDDLGIISRLWSE